jgi:hypothetical protein
MLRAGARSILHAGCEVCFGLSLKITSYWGPLAPQFGDSLLDRRGSVCGGPLVIDPLEQDEPQELPSDAVDSEHPAGLFKLFELVLDHPDTDLVPSREQLQAGVTRGLLTAMRLDGEKDAPEVRLEGVLLGVEEPLRGANPPGVFGRRFLGDWRALLHEGFQ